MSSSNVSAVTNYFSTANEGFVATLGTTIGPAATAVPLSGTAGLTNGTIFVGIIEPGLTNEQVFTGTVDTAGSQVTGVVWTRGTNTTHAAGVTIVDYVTGTAHNMMTKGLLVEHTQTGIHNLTSAATITSAKFITALNDANGNELIGFNPTASAVNQLTVTNSATGNAPDISATGSDTNISISVTPKAAGLFILPSGKTAGLVRRRQGGSTGDATWINPGTSNVDTSAKSVFIQAGAMSIPNTAGADTAVTFPLAFSQVPLVFLTTNTATGANQIAQANTVTTTTFNIRSFNSGSGNETCAWVAIGQ